MSKHISTFFCGITIILIALLVGLRGDTPDTQVYWYVYQNIQLYNLSNPLLFYSQTGMEIAFGWYSSFMHLLGANNIFFFSFYSFLILLTIVKLSRYIHVSLFYVMLSYLSSSYFFIQQFMQIRQGLAISVTMLICIAILHRRFTHCKLLYLFLMLCILIHQTSIVLIVIFMLFIFYEKFTVLKSSVLINILLIIFIIFMIKYIVMPQLIILSSRVASYSEISEYSFDRSLLSLPNIRAMLILIFIYLLTNRKLYSVLTYRFLFFCIVLAVIFRIGFSEFAILNGRISIVASFAEVFIIPMVLLYRFSFHSRLILIIIWFVMQGYISLFIQSAILIDTYFKPLVSI
ncbi:EpsG family protein [Wohlfahrtiimonas chitiniclastica]|uniref:EpsG family protein n=1 Tax=Wohlfahrtiimonas chitiniclastica TaxID=400946 RepID=UPI0003707CDE|nr:EpsG family protein [Wohlfahrtiimonas chitiniclastica]